MIRNILIAAYCIAMLGSLGRYGVEVIRYTTDPRCEWALAVIEKQEGKNHVQ